MVTCAGSVLLNKLNMVQATLIPTSQSIVTANNKSMHVMGAVRVEIRAEQESKKEYTRQFCYIGKEVTGLFISLSACEDLDGGFYHGTRTPGGQQYQPGPSKGGQSGRG